MKIRKNKEVIGGKILENPAWRKIDIWTRNAYIKKIDIPFQSFIWYKICEKSIFIWPTDINYKPIFLRA